MRSGHALGTYAGTLALLDTIKAAGRGGGAQGGQEAGLYPNSAGLKFNENGRNLLAPVHEVQWQDGKLMTI